MKWTPELVEAVRHDWLRGLQAKVIAFNRDLTYKQVTNMIADRRKRDPESWPQRRLSEKTKFTSVYMPAEVLAKAKLRAQQRGSNLSAYFRYLVERDT